MEEKPPGGWIKQEESHLLALCAVLVSWLNPGRRWIFLLRVQAVTDRESLAATVL